MFAAQCGAWRSAMLELDTKCIQKTAFSAIQEADQKLAA
jgi:hypothetical protein